MKTAILLPGYLDSPDYLHLKTFEKRLSSLGYKVIRHDPCNLWSKGKTTDYTISRYLDEVRRLVIVEASLGAEEIILLGHSLGGFISIIVGSELEQVTRIIALCPPVSYKDSLKKWENKDRRISKRFMPDNVYETKVFSIPRSFALDAQHYSALDVVTKIEKPFMIFIGLDDTVVPPSISEQLVSLAKDPYVVRKEGMGHDFRNSEVESNIVMDEIEKFLKS